MKPIHLNTMTGEVHDDLVATNFVFGYTDPDTLTALYYAACIGGMYDADRGLRKRVSSVHTHLQGRSVEIGCYLGKSTIAICQGLKALMEGPEEDKTLIVIDQFKAPPSDPPLKDHMTQVTFDRQESLESIFRDNMARAQCSNYILHKTSSETARDRGYVKGPIRFAFIDADHSYDGCRHDVEWVLEHAVSGAIVVCDDYGVGHPSLGWGVKAVVDEMLVPNCTEVVRHGTNGRTWFGRLR